MSASDRFKVKTKHSEDFVRKVIGRDSDSVLAARVAREDPALYRELQEDAIALGLRGPVPRNPWMGRPGTEPAEETGVTMEEVKAREEFSKEFCHSVLHKGPNDEGVSLSELVKENGPEWHARFRTAA